MSGANSRNLYLCSILLATFSALIAMSVALNILPLVIAFAGIELCLLVATGVQIGKRTSLKH